MTAVELISKEIDTAHEWLEGTMQDVNNEIAHWVPPGTAHPIGSRYAHMAVSEDIAVNATLINGQPLYGETWAGRTGIPNPQDAFVTTLEWAQSVKVELADLKEYTRAVYAGTSEFMAGLSDSDLAREVDMSDHGMGMWTVGSFLLTFVLGHARDIMGEISAIKGVQGGQGYPF